MTSTLALWEVFQCRFLSLTNKKLFAEKKLSRHIFVDFKKALDLFAKELIPWGLSQERVTEKLERLTLKSKNLPATRRQ